METTVKCDANPTWEEIEKRVLESFDLNDVGIRFAVEAWRKSVEKVRDAEDLGEVAHSFSSAEALDAAVAFHQADIGENLAIFKVKTARNERRLALMNIVKALGESQGVFVDEDEGEHIIPELLVVTRVSKSAKSKMLQQVVEATMTLATNGNGDSEDIKWPSSISEDFRNDLEEFLSANGDAGREIITRVCHDAGFAKKVRQDEEMPRPIRFLAQIVVEASSNNRLPNRERKIGFSSH